MKVATTVLAFATAAVAQECDIIPVSQRTGYGFVGTDGPVWGATWGEETATATGTASVGWGGLGSATTAPASAAGNTWGKGSGESIPWGKDPAGWDEGTSTVASWQPVTYGHFTGLSTQLTASPTTSSGPVQSGSWNSTTNSTASSYAKSHPGCINGPASRGCWGGGFDINTNYEESWPNTGRVVQYFLEVKNATLSPDGTPKQMLVVNGQYPGPLIEANWGDTLELTVKNSFTYNGTSMHWHGFRQLDSNPQDGVNGITECPLAPGDTKTYKFQATQYGTTWYHSHFSAQYGDGVAGPVIIHGPAAADYDIDLGHVQIAEFYNDTAFQEAWYAERFGPPTASNYLINGQNIKPDGSAGSRAKFSFTPGKKHLLRLINTSVDNHFKFTVDGHAMTVISTDFVPINPYTTDILNINIGQRYNVIIAANEPTSSYWMRALPQLSCSSNQNTGLGNANAVVQYAGASSLLPTSTVTNYTDSCQDEPEGSLVPVVVKAVDSTSFAAQASTLPLNIERVLLSTNDTVFRWTLNGISQDIDWANPTIAQVVAGNDTFPSVKDVITLTQPNTWFFWIIQNQFFVPHPLHLHGHDFSLLGQGAGTFDVTTNFDDLNFVNPPRRDVAILLASGWTVIAFQTDNPGAWLMHCHIAWHVGEGLSLQFLELPSQAASTYDSFVNGEAFQDICKNWVAYEESPANEYTKDDSGLKKRNVDGFSDVKRHAHSHKHRRQLRHRAWRDSAMHSYD